MDSEIYIDVEVDDEESDQVVNQNTDDNFAGRDVIRQDEDGNAKPYVGMEFESEDAAKALYETYSRNAGFSTHVGQFSRNKPDGPIVTWEFACSREVFRKKNVECCNAMLRIERKDENTWVATKFIEDHIHPLESPNKVHYLRPRRHFAGATENTAETLDAASDAYVSMDGNHAPDEPNRGGRSVSPVVPNPPARNVAPYDPYVSMDGNHAPYKPNHRGRSVSPVVPNPPARSVTPYDPFVSMDGNHAPYEPNRRGRSVSPVVPNPPARNVGPINYTRPSNWKRTLGRDAQNLLNYFQKKQAENPGFYYAIQLDDENRMTNVFWTDARSRTAYNYFGDAVIFDTMYRPNQYQVPFAPFTGVNHHGQMVLFGCALLLDESESSFTWLFKTWLSAMNNRSPISITTDQDRAIQVAAAQVFPDTRHCICKWHILREGQERLALVYLANPSFYGELYSCINFSEKIEDFESSWLSLLDRYDLRRNDWLQAVYNARKQWAPVYFRGTFFAAISSNQGVGSFFDGYVNQQTSIPMFFKQYERALEHALEKEIQADYDTICTTPVLKTPSPMEQQAANLYTKKVFAKFQEELVETFVYTANRIDEDGLVSKYRVAKYEHDDKVYIVELNVSEMKASCSCQMFEYAGILCRHILTVFTVTNVLTLPSQYILKRWTRNAKSWVGVDEQISDPRGVEILTVRFKNLCQEAIKYAEEGSVAVETYNAAMIALRDCGKKISDLKKNVAKAAPPSSHGSGSLEEENFIKAPLPCGEMGPPLWPWQEALPHQFNLNDVGVPISDIIQPSMVGSIQPDGAHPENTVVYTCFKSMKWVIEKKNSTSAGKVAVINLKLQDYGKNPPKETDVQFKVTRVTLEPMLRSMAYIGQQLSAPGNRVAVINLKLQDTNTTSGETEVKFQVSRNTLDSMLRSMVFIREQL